MTEKELRQKVVSTAEKYLGCKESNGSHRKIIDRYNAHKPLARDYTVKYWDSWCATFVSVVSILCDLTDIMPTECGCGSMIELYKKKNRWIENDGYVPKTGDIIMYYWKDTGKGDCVGYPDHVGIVVSVAKDVITVIEGNKNDAVGYRKIHVNGRYIRGFCVPDYKKKAAELTNKEAAKNNKPTKADLKHKTVHGSSDKKSIAIAHGKTNKPKSVVKKTPMGLYASGLKGKYACTSALHLRRSAGTDDRKNKIVETMPKGANIICYGYYTMVGGQRWLLVQHGSREGYVCSKYVKKI